MDNTRKQTKAKLLTFSKEELVRMLQMSERSLEKLAKKVESFKEQIDIVAEASMTTDDVINDMSKTFAEKEDALKEKALIIQNKLDSVLQIVSEANFRTEYHCMKVQETTGELLVKDVVYCNEIMIRQISAIVDKK